MRRLSGPLAFCPRHLLGSVTGMGAPSRARCLLWWRKQEQASGKAEGLEVAGNIRGERVVWGAGYAEESSRNLRRNCLESLPLYMS